MRSSAERRHAGDPDPVDLDTMPSSVPGQSVGVALAHAVVDATTLQPSPSRTATEEKPVTNACIAVRTAAISADIAARCLAAGARARVTQTWRLGAWRARWISAIAFGSQRMPSATAAISNAQTDRVHGHGVRDRLSATREPAHLARRASRRWSLLH